MQWVFSLHSAEGPLSARREIVKARSPSRSAFVRRGEVRGKTQKEEKRKRNSERTSGITKERKGSREWGSLGKETEKDK
jgi:hypothetical protein